MNRLITVLSSPSSWRLGGSILFLLWLAVEVHAQASADAVTRVEIREGFLPVTGGRVWYRIVGVGKQGTPLVALHGGPGYPHDCFEPLEALADERPVVLYDQLGCGRSDRPADVQLYRVERFVQELAQVRKALALERVHLLGHSWGSMVAVDYLLTRPEGIESLILAGPCLSVRRWAEDQRAYLAELPPKLREAVERNEKAGTFEAPDYQAAVMAYYKLHLCRVDPFPAAMQRQQVGGGLPVYHLMWGPSEFTVTGNLKDYERTDRLHEIKVPTLFTCGRFDEATPAATAWYQSLLPGAKIAVFEKSAHMTYLEEPERYREVLRGFLREVENAPAGK